MSKQIIKVKASPSEIGTKTFNISIQDLVDSSEKWENLSDKERSDRIQGILNDMPDQPYWALDEIIE